MYFPILYRVVVTRTVRLITVSLSLLQLVSSNPNVLTIIRSSAWSYVAIQMSRATEITRYKIKCQQRSFFAKSNSREHIVTLTESDNVLPVAF